MGCTTISRRGFAARLAANFAALAGAATAAQPSAAQARGWKICQSAALSGPLADLGLGMHEGARVCFGAINGKGGIHGRPVELNTLDDGYDTKRALQNVEGFIKDPETFALFNCMGTPMVTAMLPRAIEAGIPFFAPFTGALAARPKNARNVFNIRASYPEEAERLVQHLATLGIRRIGVVYQNNAFGKEVLQGAQLAVERHRLPAPFTITVENDASDAATAAAKTAEANPEAVLVGLAGKPTLDFVKAIRGRSRGLPLYALSVLGAAGTLRALGSDAEGIAVSQVVPTPQSPVTAVVREFQRVWKAAGVKHEPSHVALEGYINARVFAEVLRRAGPGATRASFIDAAWAMPRYDLGGFEVAFTEPGANASRFVELTMVGRGGRFVR